MPLFGKVDCGEPLFSKLRGEQVGDLKIAFLLNCDALLVGQFRGC